ncbi:hypothetical protein ACHRVW_01080 [Flavobacterium collinsii]|uniref:hypothetical protein n=1 Tax=Flavobacterium collinsii TaxID=1114861 RepID=UPI0037584866
MKPQYLFLLSLLIACQKPKPVSQIQTDKTNSEKKSALLVSKENFLKTDTLLVYTDGETSKDHYILAHLLDRKMDKDSTVTGKYQLDFYSNKTKTADTKLSIKGIDEGSEWSVIYGLGQESIQNSPFIQIRFGYPACGYTQNNYLYYLKNNSLQLVHEWYSMSDSGWGGSVEFVDPSPKTEPDSLYCRTVFFEPDDNDENMGTVKYYDSLVFRFIGNQWKKQRLSKEGQTYLEKKMSFDDFHNQK